MGIFGDLFASWRRRSSEEDRNRVLKHWGLLETAGEDVPQGTETEPSHYDRVNWRKKLQRILDELPESEPEWKDFLPDGYALGLGERWIENTLREEFTLLVRRVVADHIVTDAEHRKLDLAHQLLGLSDDEAEQIFHKVVGEAEEFFGTHVEGS